MATDSRTCRLWPTPAKYASKLYDPFFKEGTNSTLAFGDKRTHQMDSPTPTRRCAKSLLDIEEGADIVMVKPALFYLDIVAAQKQNFTCRWRFTT